MKKDGPFSLSLFLSLSLFHFLSLLLLLLFRREESNKSGRSELTGEGERAKLGARKEMFFSGLLIDGRLLLLLLLLLRGDQRRRLPRRSRRSRRSLCKKRKKKTDLRTWNTQGWWSRTEGGREGRKGTQGGGRRVQDWGFKVPLLPEEMLKSVLRVPRTTLHLKYTVVLA